MNKICLIYCVILLLFTGYSNSSKPHNNKASYKKIDCT